MPMDEAIELPGRATAEALFTQRFGEPPEFVVRAPGRVNLIGEHTDYNDGFVFPMAIPHSTWIAGRARDDTMVTIASDGYGETTFDAAAPDREERAWPRYAHGMAWALAGDGHALRGFDAAMATDIPTGASLSSSAAMMNALTLAFSVSSDFEFDPVRAAELAMVCENQWVGVPTGIMDQLISATAVAGHATLIDCRSLTGTPHPLPEGTSVVVLNTKSTRELVDSEYANRRATCQEVASILGVAALRDATMPDLDRVELNSIQRHRAVHVITENDRTIAAATAMAASDPVELGRLMTASHASLRDDYEVSGPALDAMVEATVGVTGCYGARMTGGGFAGCAVALVSTDAVDSFIEVVAAAYEHATGIAPELYAAAPADGAQVVRRPPGQTH